MSNRSSDWFGQALRDLEMAHGALDFGRFEWACFAAHQAAEKALKAGHQSLGQEAWGHDLARLLRELPESLQPISPELYENAAALDLLYVPTRYPDSYAEGAPFQHFTARQSKDAIDHANQIVDFVRRAMAGP